MKFIDLFAGIGGFRFGLEGELYKRGYKCVGSVENEKFARKSYEAIFQEEPTFGNIREVKPEQLPEAQLYTAGFPCQSFSVIGNRRGTEDKRGNLFFEIIRLAKVRKPQYLLLENVPGLLSSDQGKDFLFILNTLQDVGYEFEWQILNSQNFGVPQHRKRVFLIGHSGGITRRPIFPIRRPQVSFGGSSDKCFVVLTKKGWRKKSISTAIDHNYHKGFDNHGQRSGVITKEGKIRRLTPRECFRLQGFPDWAFERAKEVNSNTQLYQQAGNAVTVNIVKEIGKRLKPQ